MKESIHKIKQLARTIQESGRNQNVGFVDNRQSMIMMSNLSKAIQRMDRRPIPTRYSENEKLGDEISIYSINIADHERAILYYEAAIQQRQAETLRIVNAGGKADRGHELAIETLRGKIEARRARIYDLMPKPKKEGRKKDDDNPPPPPSSGSTIIGTEDQASWITGIPAWFPRKYGT